MKRGLVLLLTVFLCLAAAMVPRERRAIYTEEDVKPTPETSITKERLFCQKQTPCEWHIYNPVTKIVDVNITNTYCECGNGDICQYVEDDTATNALVYRCRPPPTKADNTTTEGSYSTMS